MKDDLQNLLYQGTPESLREAYELLNAHERVGGIPPSLEPSPFEDLEIDISRLEQIALSPTPREVVASAVLSAPIWITKLGSLVAILLTGAGLWLTIPWVQTQWYAAPSIFVKALLTLLLAGVTILSVVTIGVSTSGLFPRAVETQPNRGRFLHITELCVVGVYLAIVGLLALPSSDRSRRGANISPAAKVGAVYYALGQSGELTIVDISNGQQLSQQDPKWEELTAKFGSGAAAALSPALKEEGLVRGGSSTTTHLTNLLARRLASGRQHSCVITHLDTLECKTSLDGETYLGDVRLEKVAHGMAVFDGLDRTTASTVR